MENEYLIGDVVQLKSGSHKMVVDKIDGNLMSCVFWDEEEKKIKPVAVDLACALFMKVKEAAELG
jgi:uncharacterized protein YodC (DUF2158 family)